MAHVEYASSLSDKELRDELINAGVDMGPITATTRSLYEKKLAKLLKNSVIPGKTANHNGIIPGGAKLNASINKANTSTTAATTNTTTNTTTSKPSSSKGNRSQIQLVYDEDEEIDNGVIEVNQQTQTDPIKATKATQAQIREEPQINKSRNRYGLNDQDTSEPQQVPNKQPSLPLEFKLLNNPKTSSYTSSSNEDTSLPSRNYNNISHSRKDITQEKTNFNRNNQQQYSFLSTNNFERMNQNSQNLGYTNPGKHFESYVDYVNTSSGQNGHHLTNRNAKNLLPLSPNTLFNRSLHNEENNSGHSFNSSNSSAHQSGIYPDLSMYQQQNNTLFDRLYNSPVPPQPPHVYAMANNKPSWISSVKNVISSNLKFLIVFLVIVGIVYYSLISNEEENPINFSS